MEKENWSVEVKPNERRKVLVDDDKFLHITKVVMGEVKNGEEVKDFHVYFKRHDDGAKVVLADLSSKAEQQVTQAVVDSDEIIELSHGWKDGSVHFSGHTVKCPGLTDHDTVIAGAPQRRPKASLKDLTKKKEQGEGSSSKRNTEAGKRENWSIEVKPNESRKVTVNDEYLYVTQVALGEVKSGKEVVEGFPLYLNIHGEKMLLGTLSSESAPEAFPFKIYQNTVIELSHGWKDGSVHFSGHTVKCFGVKDFDPAFAGAPQSKPNASLKDLAREEEENSRFRKNRKLDEGKTAAEECMKIVGSFEGFEEGSVAYMKSLIYFYENESACAHFMIPERDTTRMEFLKAVLAKKNKDN